MRGDQPIEPGILLDLFYIPIGDKPITPTLMAGLMISNGVPANTINFQWDVSGLASGEYAVGARIDDHLKANGHIVDVVAGHDRDQRYHAAAGSKRDRSDRGRERFDRQLAARRRHT